MSLHVYKTHSKPGGDGDSRCTPKQIWYPALRAVGIEQWDLDPASNSFSTIPSKARWFGAKKNGLELDWFGNVWLNPPFSNIPSWLDKLMEETENVSTISLMVPGDTTTAWWKEAAESADIWATWPRRQHCPTPDQPKGSPGGPLHIFYWERRESGMLSMVNRIDRWRRIMEHVGCMTFQSRPTPRVF